MNCWWGKMQMITGPALEPRRNLRGLRAIVVQNQMHVEAGGHRLLYLVEETQELLMAVSRVAAANDFARGDVQPDKE